MTGDCFIYNNGYNLMLYKINTLEEDLVHYTTITINHDSTFDITHTYSGIFIWPKTEFKPITSEQFDTIYNKAKSYQDYIEEYTITRGEKLKSIIKSWNK